MDLVGENVHSAAPKLPVWLVVSDKRLSMRLKEELESSDSFQLQKCFAQWRSAVLDVKNSPDPPQHVVIVEGELPDSKQFNWLSLLVEKSRAVIVLLDKIDEGKLLTAIYSGVSGFLLSSLSVSQIISSIATVAEGGVVMSPEVLHHLRPQSNGSNGITSLLTSRETGIVGLLIEGYSLKEIADRLFISYLTVRTHIRNIHKKLGIKNAAGLISFALRDDLF